MSKREKAGRALLLAAVLFSSANLRAPITCVGPLLNDIRASLSLSGTTAGLLSTIPLLAFAFFSPVSGGMARRFGLGRTLMLAAASVVAGLLLRSYAGVAGLLIGTVLIGAGIGSGNVLLPVVVKQSYPQNIGRMTGIYASTMSVFSGLAVAVCVPVARAVGWRSMLALLSVLSAAAFCFWMTQRKLPLKSASAEKKSIGRRILRSKTAWYVTFYFGMQSIVFYGLSMWLPSILADRGIDAADAGVITSLFQLLGIPANLLCPMLADKFKNHRVLTAGISVIFFTGISLFCFGKTALPLSVGIAMCGFCTSASFSLCMALIGLRTHNSSDAADLSVMCQTVGYVIAAVGPVLLGKLHDAVGGWGAPLGFVFACVLLNALAGQLAGKKGYVE